MPDDLTAPGDPNATPHTVVQVGQPTVLGDSTLPPAPPGYELLGEIGAGGMGAVYRARDLAPQRNQNQNWHPCRTRSCSRKKLKRSVGEKYASPFPTGRWLRGPWRFRYHGHVNATASTASTAMMPAITSGIRRSPLIGSYIGSTFVLLSQASDRVLSVTAATGSQKGDQHDRQRQAKQQRGQSIANLSPTRHRFVLRRHV